MDGEAVLTRAILRLARAEVDLVVAYQATVVDVVGGRVRVQATDETAARGQRLARLGGWRPKAGQRVWVQRQRDGEDTVVGVVLASTTGEAVIGGQDVQGRAIGGGHIVLAAVTTEHIAPKAVGPSEMHAAGAISGINAALLRAPAIAGDPPVYGTITPDELVGIISASPPEAGMVLRGDGTNYVRGHLVANDLSDISNPSAPAAGQVLRGNGTRYVQAYLASPDLADTLNPIAVAEGQVRRYRTAAPAGWKNEAPSFTQAQSHASPDTDSAATALHHTLGVGANQAASGADSRFTGDVHVQYAPLTQGFAATQVGATGRLTTTSTTTWTAHIGTSFTLPEGTWTVRALMVGTVQNNTAGSGVDYQLGIDGTYANIRTGFSAVANDRVPANQTITVTGRTGSVAINVDFRANTSGTAAMENVSVLIVAVRTA